MLKLLIGIFISISLSYGSNSLLVKAPKNYKMDYTKNTICLVRHFKVYKYPKWVAKINLRDGKKIFFSSPKSMFEFYFRPGKWYDLGVRSENDFKDIIVTDFMSLKPVNAKEAYFVYGSRAQSPAEDDLVAFKKEQDAKFFVQKYGGTRIFKFNEVSDALIRLINGRI